MAMNSYLRPNQIQTNTANMNPDPLHTFNKDKQAWEHAISMYQGPDPLDHWYNYICWYENYAHSDPEHKFRETLERCLTVYEHNEYYKQDARLVRLWLKYIAMQTDPLHFYQVLYQRGTGRQVAALYIGWASYYESREEFKDADAVFTLAFQEKAQSNAELQHAHSKFVYARSLYFQQQQQHLQQTPQPSPQDALQQLATYTQTHHQQQQQQTHQQLSHSFAPSQHHRPQPEQPHHLQHHHQPHQHYQQPTQQVPHIYPQAQQHPTQYQPHLQQPPTQQQQQPQHAYHHHHQQTQPQPHYQHPEQPPQRYEQQLPVSAEAAVHHPQAPTQTHHYPHIVQHSQLTPPTSHYETPQQQPQQLHQQPNVVQNHAQNHQQPEQLQQNQQHQNGNSQQTHVPQSIDEAKSGLPGLRLPRNFHAYGRNNHETWKPALTLEEPDDPCRLCYYPKQLVYPAGAGIEYSPEELLARRYTQLLEQKRREKALQANQLQQVNHVAQQEQQQVQLKKETVTAQHGYATGVLDAPQQFQQLQQQEQQSLYDSYESEASYYMTAVDGALNAHNNSSATTYNGATDNTEDNDDGNEDANDNDHGDDSEDENEDEDDDDDGDGDGDGDDETNEAEDEVDEAYANGNACYGIQFTAQTTFEQENRSIKIKFKKEHPVGGTDKMESSTYSAYTIESIYHKQELPASPKLDGMGRQRNGHHFHPYMLGQTSTPKSESGTNGYKRSKIKRNKFHAELCSNSNSSSLPAELTMNGDGLMTVNAATGASATGAAAASGVASVATVTASIQNATFNDNANFSFSSASALENSNSSLASAVDRLNFRDVSHVASNNKTLQSHNNNNTNNNNNHNNTTTVADFSTFQENSYFATQHDIEAKERRLSKALETIERHMAKEAIDPFNSELCRAFLAKLEFPGNDEDANAIYKIVQTPLPKISNTRTLNVLDGVQFNIDKEVGRGSYGSVYKATDARTGNVVALKFQKPPNTWEIYICDQVLKRITEPEVLPGLMDISTAIIAPNASLIATEFSPFGSLLDINNKIRQATTKVMHESLVMHFSSQICNIVNHLHRHHIIHADIKPDNFLLMRVPSVDSPLPSLRLIDFGCAIDMSLFPNAERTKFRKVVQTDGFTCIEMQEGRPWSYETDLFCIAGTVHVMLFGYYMQPQKRGANWDIRLKLPRYLKKHVWTKFFGELLNTRADKLPDLKEMRDIFEAECYRMESELLKQIRTLSNILHRR